jgi:hypothetical protein
MVRSSLGWCPSGRTLGASFFPLPWSGTMLIGRYCALLRSQAHPPMAYFSANFAEFPFQKLSDKWGAAGTMAYASAHENISYRSFRRAVQPHRATPTCRQPAGTPQDPRSARDPKRRLLRPEERLSLAVATPRVSALEDRLPLVSELGASTGGGSDSTPRCASACGRGWAKPRSPVPG